MRDRAPKHFPILITHEVAIGRQPVEREIVDLCNTGFKSIINVRSGQELDQPLSPAEEGRLVEQSGMSYSHHPITVADLDDRVADQFLQILSAVDKPVLVHCENGLRAALFSLMFVACDERRGGDWVLERAGELGFELRAPLLRTFARAYVDRNLRIQGVSRRSA